MSTVEEEAARRIAEWRTTVAECNAKGYPWFVIYVPAMKPIALHTSVQADTEPMCRQYRLRLLEFANPTHLEVAELFIRDRAAVDVGVAEALGRTPSASEWGQA